MLHTICGGGMTLRLIRPICPFNCFLFRVDSLYHLRLNGRILQIIRSLTDHINGFDFISTLAAALSFFSGLAGSRDREACLSSSEFKKKGEKKEESWTGWKKVYETPQNLETSTRSCSWAKKHPPPPFFLEQEQDWEQWSRYQEGVTSFLYILYMYSVMKIQLVISHSLSFIWSKRAHDKWSMRNPSKLALCENMSHPCLSSTEWTSSAPQAPPLPYSHSPLHKATRTRQFA